MHSSSADPPVHEPPTISTENPSKRKSAGGSDLFHRRQSESQPTGPESKRAKANLITGDSGASRMSKVLGKRPEVVDLTKPRSSFQPQNGPKKIVIKNLRTPSRANLEHYYAKTLEELDDALQAIFARRQPKQPLERLYRGVEDTCRHGKSEELYNRLRRRCETYLNNDLLNSIKAEGGSSNVDMLKSVHKHWVIWEAQSVRFHHPSSTSLAKVEGLLLMFVLSYLDNYSIRIQLPRPVIPPEFQRIATDK